MEMDLVAHCGGTNKGSYVNSLVLTDIASGWTECAPLVVRESGLLIEVLERIRIGLPFCSSRTRCRQWQRIRERGNDPILPPQRHRAHAVASLSKK